MTAASKTGMRVVRDVARASGEEIGVAGASFEDRVLIRETYGRYAVASARQDGEGWIGCWAGDGTWATPNFEMRGHAGLREAWAMTWTMFASVGVFNEVGEIAVSGDTATALCAVHEIFQLADGRTATMTGLYADRLVREGDGWRFAERRYSPISASGASLTPGQKDAAA